MKNLNLLADEIKEEVFNWRRHFHENPELSFQEEKTIRNWTTTTKLVALSKK